MLSTRKAHELDVVELSEDLPEYGLKRGERGTVVVAFHEPDEAYDLEFVDETGASRFAYSVKPQQLRSTEELLKQAYEQGMQLLNEGKSQDAEEAFKRAVELRPESIGNLHNSILEFHETATKGLGSLAELNSLVAGLRFVLRVKPDFQMARHNIAVVYLNYGFQRAIEGDIETAVYFYDLSMSIDSPAEVVACARNNLASAYTVLSVRSQQKGDLESALQYSVKACEVDPNTVTRHNLGAGFANLGWVFLNKRDFRTAIELFEKSLDTGLMAPELLNNYGVALSAIGLVDQAIVSFRRALDLSPDNQGTINNLRALERVKKSLASADELSTQIADFIHMSPIEPYRLAA
jgi:tetratricopeptide (TPR) repeat protein